MPLAYYSRAASQEFWSEHWAGEDVGALVDVARRSPLTSILEAALPPHGRVLEAGCGLGQYVILLRARGRGIAGVDWSLDALRRCRTAAPGTPVAVMDLAALAVRTASLAAYVSLGVVEHDAAGPDAIVAEAARVLAPGGRLLLSVPYWNGVRRLCTPHLVREARRTSAAGGQFYQFAFSRREVRRFVESHGFRVLSFHPYDPARMPRKALRRLLVRRAQRDTAPAARGEQKAESDNTSTAHGAGHWRRMALARIAYSGISLRLFAHMILAVAVRR